MLGATVDELTKNLEEVVASVAKIGFEVLGVSDCVIHGPKGNREAFLHARRAPMRRPTSSHA